jgi:ribose 5-phosphate isomerase A
MSAFDQEAAKKAVAAAALAHVPESGLIGLGSGSTVTHFIDGIGRLVAEGRRLTGVPTSEQSRRQAEALGIPLASQDGPWDITLTVDGADEVNEELDLIKGGGAAHTREKIVNYASRKNIIVVDESKLSRKLGEQWHVPIEVLSFAFAATSKALERFGDPTRRIQNGKVVVTDSGNFIIDLKCGVIDTPLALDTRLRAIPGVVETGLFCGRADLILVAGPHGIREISRTS